MDLNLNEAPEAVKSIPDESINKLDVRAILQAGGEPFSEIMTAIKNTDAKGALRLRATFEPKPLFKVLGAQGWSHWVEYGFDDDWVIWFYQNAEALTSRETMKPPLPTEPPAKPPSQPARPKGLESLMARNVELARRINITKDVWILDVRELFPPEPMEMTLAVLEHLPENVILRQINERVPQFLLPLLPTQNMLAEVVKNQEKEVHIEIKRRGVSDENGDAKHI